MESIQALQFENWSVLIQDSSPLLVNLDARVVRVNNTQPQKCADVEHLI